MMKTIILCLLATVFCEQVSAEPKMEIASHGYDFGIVPQNCTVTYETWLRSTGDDTLVISQIKTGCGCLTAPVDHDLLPSGDSTNVVFHWQTRNQEGPVTLNAYLFSNAGTDPEKISLSAVVTAAFDSTSSISWAPLVIRLASYTRTDNELDFEIRNRSGIDLGISLIPGILNELQVDIPESIPAGASVSGTLSVGEGLLEQAFERSFTIELSQKVNNYDRFTIPVIMGDFSFRPDFSTTN